jgi:hypothetical protein
MPQYWKITTESEWKFFQEHRSALLLRGKDVRVQFVDKTRTPAQNNSLWKYCEMLAEKFNDSGYERIITSKVLSKAVEVPWCKDSVKEDIWNPVMFAVTGATSSRDLGTADVDKVYRVIHRHLASNMGISVAFPSKDTNFET